MYCVGDPVNRSDPTGHIWQTLIAKARKLASEFHLPNYVAVPVPKSLVRISAGAEAARAMQASRTLENTHDMSALANAADYIGGKKPKINWGNDGGELHGTAKWETGSVPNHMSIGPASSSSKRSIPVVGKSYAKPISGRPTNSGGPSNFGSPPSYDQAMTSKPTMELWNADTVANAIPPPRYQVYLEAHPRPNHFPEVARRPPEQQPQPRERRNAMNPAQARRLLAIAEGIRTRPR